MKVIKIDIKQGQYCSECGMPDKFLVSLEYALFCLDCLDRARKMMLIAIEENKQKSEVTK